MVIWYSLGRTMMDGYRAEISRCPLFPLNGWSSRIFRLPRNAVISRPSTPSTVPPAHQAAGCIYCSLTPPTWLRLSKLPVNCSFWQKASPPPPLSSTWTILMIFKKKWKSHTFICVVYQLDSLLFSLGLHSLMPKGDSSDQPLATWGSAAV